jgi:dienelactone hydrolase
MPNWIWIVIALGALVLLPFVLARFTDRLQERLQVRALARRVAAEGYDAVAASLAARIAELERKIEETKRQAASAHSYGPVSGALGGVFNELQQTRQNKALLERELGPQGPA